MSCQICCQNFTTDRRKEIQCSECKETYCLECFQNYLLKSEEFNTKCLLCDKKYNYLEIISITGNKAFSKKVLEKFTIKDMMLEESKLAETQWNAKARKEYNEIMEEGKKVKEIIKKARYQINFLQNQQDLRIYEHYRKYSKENSDKNEYTFIKNCSHESCKGQLSTSWQCGLCSKYTCSKCHGPKERYKDDSHVCDENVVKNIEAVKKESRPCPKCGTAISKIDGCDQMWCVSCHATFSWKTGMLINGYIHNPEYFRYMRENNIDIARNPDDVVGANGPECLNIQTIFRNFRYNKSKYDYLPGVLINSISEIFRFTLHLNYEINVLNEIIDQENTRVNLRVNFLLNVIDKENWHKRLKKVIKKEYYNRERVNIINTLKNISIDIVNNIVYIINNEIKTKEEKYIECTKQINAFVEWLDRQNGQLINCSELFGLTKESYRYNSSKIGDNVYISHIYHLARTA